MSENLAAPIPCHTKADFDERFALINRKLINLNQEMADVLTQIQVLEDSKGEIQKSMMTASKELVDLESEEKLFQLESIRSSLRESHENLHEYDEICAKISIIREERQNYLKNDTELEKDLNDYIAFASQSMVILNSLPSSYYRQSLEEAHHRLEQRVTPLISLNEREKGLLEKSHLDVHVFIGKNPSGDEVIWIMPFNMLELATQNENKNGIAYDLFNSLVYLEADPNWYITNTYQEEWDEFFVYSIRGELSDEKSLVQTTQRLLFDLLPGRLPVLPSSININVDEIPWNVWLVGKEQSQAQAVITTTEEPESITLTQQIFDTTILFTQKDLVSWERPFKTSAKSNWNVSGRRLRTIFMRLIAKGKVGENSIPEESLWQGLPDTHAKPIKKSIKLLVENGLLICQKNEDQGSIQVSINPARLQEVQELIERDITQFWVGLIQ